jgi:hypothetical protein
MPPNPPPDVRDVALAVEMALLSSQLLALALYRLYGPRRTPSCPHPARTMPPHDGARPRSVLPNPGYFLCRGQDRQSRAVTLRLLRREKRRVEREGLKCGDLQSERN